MNYKDVAITDLIEWWILIPLGLAFIGWLLYSWVRTALTDKKAGSYTMAKIIDALKGKTNTEPKPEPVTVPASTVLVKQYEQKLNAAEGAERSAESHRAAADADTERANTARNQAAALDQAAKLLEQAGL